MTKTRRFALLSMALVLVCAACSSKGNSNARKSSSGGLSLESGQPAATDASAAAPGAAAAGEGATGAAPASTGAGGARSTSRSTAGSTGPSGAAIPVPPVSKPKGTPISLGLYYTTTPSGPGAMAPGAAWTVIGDGGVFGKKIVDWMNTHGGIAGHPVNLITYGYVVGENRPQVDQAACTKFTRDVKVAAVAMVSSPTAAYYQCMAGRGAISIDPDFNPVDQATFMKYPDRLYSLQASQDRVGATLASELARNGYLKDAGIKLGIVYDDEPRNKAAVDAFVRGVNAAGVKPTATDPVCAAGCDSAQLQNEVLKFRGAGINHVVMLGQYAHEFIRHATAQSFYPRYGLTSQNAPLLSALAESPTAMRNAVGVGQFPSLDVNQAQEPPVNSQVKLCQEIIFGPGRAAPSRLADAQARGTCEPFFFYKFILEKNGGNTAPDAVRATVDKLGGQYTPVATISNAFGPTKHDGADTYYPLSYDLGCRCFKYVGGPRPMARLPGQ